MQLFIYSYNYLSDYFTKPAWAASLIGDFLTQLFYFNIAGTLVLSLLIGFTGYLVFRATESILTINRAHNEHAYIKTTIRLALSIVVMCLECVRNFSTDYKLSVTVALLFGLLTYLLYIRISSKFRIIISILLLSICYWMFGYAIFVTLILIVLNSLRKREYFIACLFLLYGMVLPLSARQHYRLTYAQAYSIPWTINWQKPDFATEELLKYDIYASGNNWNLMAAETETSKSKSGLTAYYYNLSHGMRGDLPSKLLAHSQPGTMALLLPLNPQMSHLAIWASNEAWFQMGDMTMAEHSALLAMIFSPEHRSSRMVKRLAEINMINRDTMATLKYLRLLQKTWLYKSWADDRMPGKESTNIRNWLLRKRKQIAQTDTIRDAVNPINSLRTLLNTNKENKAALDYLLCYELLSKDITNFLEDYKKYKLSAKEAPDKIYAEAIVLALSLKKMNGKQLEKYMIAEKTYNEFINFTILNQKKILGPKYMIDKFGKTYWFYYFYASLK